MSPASPSFPYWIVSLGHVNEGTDGIPQNLFLSLRIFTIALKSITFRFEWDIILDILAYPGRLDHFVLLPKNEKAGGFEGSSTSIGLDSMGISTTGSGTTTFSIKI